MARLDMALLAKANIDSAVASGDTSISVDDTSLFPSNTPFRVVLASKRTNLIPSDVEVVEVGSVDGTNNNLDSCTRGLEGTTAQSWSSGDIVENRATPELLNQISQALYDGNLARILENASGNVQTLTDIQDNQGNTIYDYSAQEIALAVIQNVLSHSDLSDAPSTAHHDPANQDVDSVDGYDIEKDGTDGSGIINFKTS